MEWKGPTDPLSDHIVLCNCNDKLARIVQEISIATAGAPVDVLLIAQDEELWRANPAWHPDPRSRDRFFVLAGCPSERSVLNRACVRHARAAIILADPRQGELADARSTLIALAIEEQNREVYTVVDLVRSENRVHLKNTHVDDVVCVSATTEKLIAQSCVTPWVKNVFKHLLAPVAGTTQIFTVSLPADSAGLTYRQLAQRSIDADAPYVICGFVLGGSGAPSKPSIASTPRARASSRRIVISPKAGEEPGKDTILSPDDKLIVIARKPPGLEPEPARAIRGAP